MLCDRDEHIECTLVRWPVVSRHESRDWNLLLLPLDAMPDETRVRILSAEELDAALAH